MRYTEIMATVEVKSGDLLDLCCGSGKAFIQAARLCADGGSRSIQIKGVDLVGMFPSTSIAKLV